MKINTCSYALLTAIAGALLVAPSAHAADGQIDFTGSVTGLTCEINGSAGFNNLSVALPAVSASALSAAGSTAGRTPFAISLENCTPGTGNVAVQFESGPTVNASTGQLIADAGGADSVEIRLLNGDYSKINVGKAFASQNSLSVPINSGKADLNYYAEYVSEAGNATVGAVNSRVQYTLIYQ
jgi:major type 1 subunit fimbrin (pilin)